MSKIFKAAAAIGFVGLASTVGLEALAAVIVGAIVLPLLERK